MPTAGMEPSEKCKLTALDCCWLKITGRGGRENLLRCQAFSRLPALQCWGATQDSPALLAGVAWPYVPGARQPARLPAHLLRGVPGLPAPANTLSVVTASSGLDSLSSMPSCPGVPTHPPWLGSRPETPGKSPRWPCFPYSFRTAPPHLQAPGIFSHGGSCSASHPPRLPRASPGKNLPRDQTESTAHVWHGGPCACPSDGRFQRAH